MKRNRLFKVFTSAVLTGAMVMSMGGMTAFAAVSEVDLTKKVAVDGNTYAPNTSFSFVIGEGDAGEKEGDVVYAGVAGGLYLDSANDFSFAPSDLIAADYYTKTGAIKVNASVFTSPGIYHYTLREDIPAEADRYDGITYDESSYDVYVYVVTDGNGLSVDAVVGTLNGQDYVSQGSEKATALVFENDYGKNEDTTHDVIITKAVTGNQGDKSKDFEFDVSVNGAEGEWYKVVKTNKNGEETASHVESGEPSVVYTLKDGESIHIYGLSANDTYTVNEHDYTADGYTTENGANSGKLTADNTQITVTNTKNVSTPTGIVMNFAPYILMVALAGVFAVLFLRRKREEF